MKLSHRLLAVHAALSAAGVSHAFGGAIALAYWTLDPRGTSDVDVNVFEGPEAAERVLGALPDGVAHDEHTIAQIHRDGQVRVFWDRTPLDLFFNYAPIHDQAGRGVRVVPFAGVEIPVLGPVELAVLKAMFDRTRDWADIEAMIAARTLDVEAVGAHLQSMVGDDDPRLVRLAELAAQG